MFRYSLLTFIVFTTLLSCKTDTQTTEGGNDTVRDTLIAYNVLVDPSNYNYDIFVTDLEGKKHTNISNNDCLDWVYSAHGDKLFVISDRDTCARCYFLYETDPLGKKWRKISEKMVQDSWIDTRNNGQELIIKPQGSANTTFEIINKNGELVTQIDPGMTYFNDPCFSADGSQIVFRGYNGNLDEVNRAELYLYDLNTKERKQLTQYPEDGKPFGHFLYYAGPPRWNDSMDRISFSSSNKGKSIIHSVDIEGKNNKKLTRGNIKAIWHDITTDGKWIAFDGQLDFKADSTTSQIFISNFEKRNTIKITNGSGYKQGPVFLYSAKK